MAVLRCQKAYSMSLCRMLYEQPAERALSLAGETHCSMQ